MNAVAFKTSILIFNLLFVFSASIEYVEITQKQNGENLFPFLGYLQGFKLGQNFALELPSFVLSPIIVVPLINQNRSFITEPNNNEHFEKTEDHIRNISYSKLSSNFAVKSGDFQDDEKKDPNLKDISVKEKRLAESDIVTDLSRKAIGEDSNINGTTDLNEVLTTTASPEFNNTNTENQMMNNETNVKPALYPSALYNNEFLNNLTITMRQIESNFTLPSLEGKLQNFSLSSNESNVVLSNTNNTNITAELGISPTTQSSVITNLFPYPNAIYNSIADKLSITTNPYLDQGSNLPSYDDRWQSFSSLTKMYPTSGFQPLAGLYYDGFLHQSLNKKTGFIPFGGNNNYYEK